MESPEDQKIKLLTAGAAFPLTEEAYSDLSKKDEWSLMEVIWIFRIKPEDVRRVYGWMESSLNTGKLKPTRYEHLDNGGYRYFYDPFVIIRWAISKEIQLPDKLTEWYKKQGKPKPAEVPPYLDTEHPLHSPELAIAIEAWTAVLQTNPDKPKTGSRKQLIERYLNEKHPKLEQAAKDRITVQINPDKTGGAPKTDN